MLHELVFLGCHTQIASYPYMFALYLYVCKILQPYFATTVRMRSDAVLSSTGALLIKTVIKNNCQQQMIHFCFGRIRWPDTCEESVDRCGSVSPVCRYVLAIISVKISHRYDKTSLKVISIAVSLNLKVTVPDFGDLICLRSRRSVRSYRTYHKT